MKETTNTEVEEKLYKLLTQTIHLYDGVELIFGGDAAGLPDEEDGNEGMKVETLETDRLDQSEHEKEFKET